MWLLRSSYRAHNTQTHSYHNVCNMIMIIIIIITYILSMQRTIRFLFCRFFSCLPNAFSTKKHRLDSFLGSISNLIFHLIAYFRLLLHFFFSFQSYILNSRISSFFVIVVVVVVVAAIVVIQSSLLYTFTIEKEQWNLSFLCVCSLGIHSTVSISSCRSSNRTVVHVHTMYCPYMSL